MCKNSKLEVISQNQFGYIGQCTGCRKYNLVFGNLFLLLVEEELQALGRMIEDNFGIFYHQNAIGNGKYVSMTTPLQNLYLAFSLQEYETFSVMLFETNLVLEARQILHNSYKKSE